MKTITTLLTILAATTFSFAQGLVHFANGNPTLISADGLPMPVYGTQPFIFAIFLAPSTTVVTTGITPSYSDPVWQLVGGYNTNNSVTPGFINNRSKLDVGTPTGYFDGSTVDFIIRGWSANAGGTWADAKANWNNGTPLAPMFIGTSTIGNDFLLSFEFTTRVFGSGPSRVAGFNIVEVPEPAMIDIAGLGAAALWLFRRR